MKKLIASVLVFLSLLGTIHATAFAGESCQCKTCKCAPCDCGK